mmetsp:Transcript_762/g.1677  ORF Transcript_762/g.1677 Transcript_762/m.1677 type:complete len:217 (-) Transcript_762:1227-1877(-)
MHACMHARECPTFFLFSTFRINFLNLIASLQRLRSVSQSTSKSTHSTLCFPDRQKSKDRLQVLVTPVYHKQNGPPRIPRYPPLLPRRPPSGCHLRRLPRSPPCHARLRLRLPRCCPHEGPCRLRPPHGLPPGCLPPCRHALPCCPRGSRPRRPRSRPCRRPLPVRRSRDHRPRGHPLPVRRPCHRPCSRHLHPALCADHAVRYPPVHRSRVHHLRR